jgi:hypothetical protein
MKRCTQCGKSFDDPTLIYCLNDGKPLVESDPLAQTLLMHEGEHAGSCKTALMYVHNKVVRVSEGDYYEFKAKTGSIRITLKQIGEYDFPSPVGGSSSIKTGAILIAKMNNLKYPQNGSAVIRIGENEFGLQVMASGSWEEEISIFAFITIGVEVEFFRLYLEHVNLTSKTVDFNISYFVANLDS